MFKLGKQVETALMALRDLDESPSGLSITQIAEKNSLSKNTLSKVLQSLMAQGLVNSAQGVKGGYKVLKPLSEIEFYALLHALDEIRPLMCSTDEGCDFAEQCSIKTPLQKWETRFLNFLKETTIKDLVGPEEIQVDGSEAATSDQGALND